MKASENAIGRGTRANGAQKCATCFELMQNKLINDVAFHQSCQSNLLTTLFVAGQV